MVKYDLFVTLSILMYFQIACILMKSIFFKFIYQVLFCHLGDFCSTIKTVFTSNLDLCMITYFGCEKKQTGKAYQRLDVEGAFSLMRCRYKMIYRYSIENKCLIVIKYKYLLQNYVNNHLFS